MKYVAVALIIFLSGACKNKKGQEVPGFETRAVKDYSDNLELEVTYPEFHNAFLDQKINEQIEALESGFSAIMAEEPLFLLNSYSRKRD